MNPFDRVLAAIGLIRKEKAANPSSYSGGGVSDPFGFWRSQKKVDPQRALEGYNNWVYAAIRAIGMDVGTIKWRLFKLAEPQDEEQFEHELLDLLGAVNDYMTGFDLGFTTAAHLEAVGNAYWFLEGVEREGQKPLAIHTLIPSKVKVIFNPEQFPPRIEGYEYKLGNKTFYFKPFQVIHIKYSDPLNPLEGIGTIQAGAGWIDADNAAMDFNRGFFKNGARIGGTLKTEAAYTPEQLKYLKVSFEDAFKGTENAYKILALPKGTTYEEGGSTQKDLDFVNGMNMMRDRIIAAFKVPRTALGITDEVNRANAEATEYVFAKHTIKPIMTIITSYLNEFLVPLYGEDIYLSFHDPVPEDRALRMDEMAKATGGNPVMTTNEARAEYFGLDPVPGGDELQIPFNFMPLGTDLGDTGDSGTPKSAAKPNGKKTVLRTRFALNMRRRRAIAATIKSKADAAIDDVFKQIKEMTAFSRKSITELSDDDYETIYKGFAIRVTPYEKKFRKHMRDFNDVQRLEVKQNLPEIAKAIDKADLFDRKENIAALADLMKPLVYDLTGKEGKEAAALLGISELDILTPEVRKALDRAMELMSRSYNDTTLDLLKVKLEEGMKQGLGLDELAKTIDDIYEFSDEVRAAAVARTETFRIANSATQEAWKQSGVVKSQKWYTAADERVCPYCGPLHGKIISIEQQFFKKGEEVTGSDGTKITVDYADVDAPPLHVNCRCYIRPEEISLE